MPYNCNVKSEKGLVSRSLNVLDPTNERQTVNSESQHVKEVYLKNIKTKLTNRYGWIIYREQCMDDDLYWSRFLYAPWVLLLGDRAYKIKKHRQYFI